MSSLVTSGSDTRKRRNRGPKIEGSGDRILLRSAAVGSNCQYYNGVVQKRHYVPGNINSLANWSGPTIAAHYATGVFKPGTKLRWEPTISPISGGRVFVGFTDNPEVAQTLELYANVYYSDKSAANYDAFAIRVKGLGNLISFPAWVEKDIPFPTKLRRKRFDVNTTASFSNVDVLDRSCQVSVFMCADGFADLPNGSLIGSFWHYDVLDLEGLTGAADT